MTVEGVTLNADLRVREKTFDEFVDEADFAVIEDAYRRAAHQFSPDLTRTYAEHLAGKIDTDDEVDALRDAHAIIAAMGLEPEVKYYLEDQADSLANKWFDKYRVEIMSLSDERQDQYRQIKGMSAEPETVWVSRPHARLEPTIERKADGSELPLPTYQHHLLCDADGLYPAILNDPEKKVLAEEMKRPGFVAWFRNPPRPSQDSVAVAYVSGTGFKLMRPDFVIFSRKPDGSVVADIVDPHGTYLADALPKLKGFSDYAEENQAAFRRIDAIEEIDGTLRVLDLKNANVRKAVRSATDAKSLYQGPAASNY